MSNLEDDLKQTLAAHENDARPRSGSFDAVEAKVRRASTRRAGMAAALAIIVIGAAGVTVPQLISGDDPEGFANPSGEPTASASAEPGPLNGSVTFRSEQHAVQLRVPDDWRIGGFEGSIEFNPPGEPGLTLGDPTTALELMVLAGEYFDEADGFRPAGTVGGRDAVQRSTGPHSLLMRVDWTGAGCTPGAICDAEQATLQILVHASDNDRDERWGETLGAMVRTIEPTHTAAYPSGEVRTPRGSVADGVTYDATTAALVSFLEARVATGGAEDHLSDAAAARFADPATGLDLYVHAGTDTPWLTYAVFNRTDGPGGAAGFDVRMIYDDIPGHGPAGAEERLDVDDGLITDARETGEFVS